MARITYADGAPATVDFDVPKLHTDMPTRPGPRRLRTETPGRMALPSMNSGEWESVQRQLARHDAAKDAWEWDMAADPVRITLRAHRLRVRLRDERDRPLRSQEVEVFAPGHGIGTTNAYGEVDLLVAPGAQGRLQVPRLGAAPLLVPIYLPETGNESSLDVQAPDRVPGGTLSFRLRAPEGWGIALDWVTATGPIHVHEALRDGESMHLAPGIHSVTLSARMVTPWNEPDHAFGCRE